MELDTLRLWDEELKKIISSVLNINFSNDSWKQATLPIGLSGLGIRTPMDIALPAFLGSVSQSQTLISQILAKLDDIEDTEFTSGMN